MLENEKAGAVACDSIRQGIKDTTKERRYVPPTQKLIQWPQQKVKGSLYIPLGLVPVDSALAFNFSRHVRGVTFTTRKKSNSSLSCLCQRQKDIVRHVSRSDISSWSVPRKGLGADNDNPSEQRTELPGDGRRTATTAFAVSALLLPVLLLPFLVV